VPADGFYDWKVEGGRKRPYCVRPKNGEPIAFRPACGKTWIGPNGEELEDRDHHHHERQPGYLAVLHDRMPVIVPPDAFDFWLDCRNVDAPAATRAAGFRR